MEFVKLTLRSGKKVLVNIEAITSIRPYDNLVYIGFKEGHLIADYQFESFLTWLEECKVITVMEPDI